jgi:hypothetical protein
MDEPFKQRCAKDRELFGYIVSAAPLPDIPRGVEKLLWVLGLNPASPANLHPRMALGAKRFGALFL